MTDLLAMLRKIQNLKPGDMMPEEWGPGEWGTPLSKLCGEAADEIERLRTRGHPQWVQWSVPNDPLDWSPSSASKVNDALVEAMHQRRDVIAAQVLNDEEPWGSPYAMNPENWK